MKVWVGRNSLRFRLLTATAAALTLALLLAWLLLTGLFRDHVMRQNVAALTVQLDQLTAQLEFDTAGQPLVDPQTLPDPRWQKPYSGLYWQIDRLGGAGQTRTPVLRSRSLWDASLSLVADALADGAVHVHEGVDPRGQPLLIVERTVHPAEHPDVRWRLVVAGDVAQVSQAVQRFSGVLAASLAGLLLLLLLAALAQTAVGLAPLRALQRTLGDLRAGRSRRLEGRFPLEVQPLIEDFNRVLDRHEEVIARARTQAGNLAHALKTPLAVMDQAALRAAHRRQGDEVDWTGVVTEQVALARRQIDWHLTRARVAASQAVPGQHTAVMPVVKGLLRLMTRVHVARELQFETQLADDLPAFAGEEQDLQEMVGNLLDNACKWARQRIVIDAAIVREGEALRLRLRVTDDGPGIADDQLPALPERGLRLDETVPGTGLGLAIVHELAELYGGSLNLARSTEGGLTALLDLPAVSR